jgi:hypothetical protein
MQCFILCLPSQQELYTYVFFDIGLSTGTIGVHGTVSNFMSQANGTMPHFNTYISSFSIDASYIQGGYTSLLLGVDQHTTSTVRQLRFDGEQNNTNI